MGIRNIMVATTSMVGGGDIAYHIGKGLQRAYKDRSGGR